MHPKNWRYWKFSLSTSRLNAGIPINIEYRPPKTIRLLHGSTNKRNKLILKNGPDPDFIEPYGFPAEGFSTSPEKGPYPVGSPADYAHSKANIFQDEGGPSVIYVDVPISIIKKSIRTSGEVRFEKGYGLDELYNIWKSLNKGEIPYK